MNRHCNIIVIGAVATLLIATHTSAGSSGKAAVDTLAQRNIFNTQRRVLVDPELPVYYFKLTGTMTADGRSLAFFDGTNRRLQNKVLTPAEKIGGYTVTEIDGDWIKLQAPGQPPVTLRIGAQLAEIAANSPKEKQ